jgi:hypothetical protein
MHDRGRALLGDTDAVARHLDHARTLLAAPDDDLGPDAPPYLHHHDLATLDEQAAGAYRTVGQADIAIALYQGRIRVLPTHLRRDRAYQTAKLANAILDADHPDPDHAAALALDCVETADTTGSARIRVELDHVSCVLTARWPNLPASRALHDALATG